MKEEELWPIPAGSLVEPLVVAVEGRWMKPSPGWEKMMWSVLTFEGE